jgi:ribose-phosphate pyrophosphokinase
MYEKFHGRKDVICVSTDAGSANSTRHFAEALGVEYAIGNKIRPKQEKTDLIGIVGNLEGKKIAIIGDDESVTVSSLLNIVKWLYKGYDTKEGEHISIKETYILISHNKIRPKHLHKLVEAHERYGLSEFHVTDTIPQTDEILSLPFIRVHSLAERISRTINRIHYNQSVSKLFYQPKE